MCGVDFNPCVNSNSNLKSFEFKWSQTPRRIQHRFDAYSFNRWHAPTAEFCDFYVPVLLFMDLLCGSEISGTTQCAGIDPSATFAQYKSMAQPVIEACRNLPCNCARCRYVSAVQCTHHHSRNQEKAQSPHHAMMRI